MKQYKIMFYVVEIETDDDNGIEDQITETKELAVVGCKHVAMRIYRWLQEFRSIVRP